MDKQPKVAADILRPAEGVVDIPDKPLLPEENATLWSQDRVRLGSCVMQTQSQADTIRVLQKRDTLQPVAK